MKGKKRVALYARVSTDGQSVKNQLRELEAVAVKEGREIVERFVDKEISGSKGREGRPAFDALCKGIVQREYDVIASWSVDRLGRSLQDLVIFLNELHSKHTNLYLHKQGIDTTTPAGKLLFQMLGVFAEFERSMIVERVKAGLKKAKAEGKNIGQATSQRGCGGQGARITGQGQGYEEDCQDVRDRELYGSKDRGLIADNRPTHRAHVREGFGWECQDDTEKGYGQDERECRGEHVSPRFLRPSPGVYRKDHQEEGVTGFPRITLL